VCWNELEKLEQIEDGSVSYLTKIENREFSRREIGRTQDRGGRTP
jgi:hypothetical protein